MTNELLAFVAEHDWPWLLYSILFNCDLSQVAAAYIYVAELVAGLKGVCKPSKQRCNSGPGTPWDPLKQTTHAGASNCLSACAQAPSQAAAATCLRCHTPSHGCLSQHKASQSAPVVQ